MPYLDVVAALNDAGDRLTLFAVNRDTAARSHRRGSALAGFAGLG